MEIRLTDSGELSNYEYHIIKKGRVYYAPGRLLIVEDDDKAILILTGTESRE